ncbi:MAG: hypothetical protein ACRD1T_19950, partial [Acidimicrobiia bacterium]
MSQMEAGPPKLQKIKDEDLRSRLELAHSQLRAREATEAVRVLADSFIQMLTKHPDLFDATSMVRGRRMPVVMRWPALGANLAPGSIRERNPRIEFVRDHFAMSEA